MARARGQANYASNFEVLKETPLDARTVVDSSSELILEETWQDDEGKAWLYNGLGVIALNNGNVQFYVLINKDDYTNASSWSCLTDTESLIEEIDQKIEALDASVSVAISNISQTIEIIDSSLIALAEDIDEWKDSLDADPILELEVSQDSSVIYLDSYTISLQNGAIDGGPQAILPSATTSSAGVMTATDKLRLDAIYAGNLPLVRPTITGSWTFYDNDESEVEPSSIQSNPSPTASNISIEEGYRASFSGTYSWTATDGYKNPERIGSGSSWSDLPSSGVQSSVFTSPIVNTGNSYTIKLLAAKTGLMVSGTNVVPANGDDATTASFSISFSKRRYYGVANSNIPTSELIKGLASQLTSTRSMTASGVTCSGTEYYYYAYPTSLGDLTKIIQDGATPVLTAFIKSTLSIVNEAGLEINLNVYVSANPGAFTNASLQFN